MCSTMDRYRHRSTGCCCAREECVGLVPRGACSTIDGTWSRKLKKENAGDAITSRLTPWTAHATRATQCVGERRTRAAARQRAAMLCVLATGHAARLLARTILRSTVA